MKTTIGPESRTYSEGFFVVISRNFFFIMEKFLVS